MTRTLSEAIDLVLPFASDDETREHLTRPARHTSHVVATDGHTLAVARYDGIGADSDRTWDRESACGLRLPPWEHVTSAAPRFLGWWDPRKTPQIAHFPEAWSVCVQFGGNRAEATVDAWIPARTGRHGKVLREKIDMVRGQAYPGFEELKPAQRVAVNGGYLVRVSKFMWQQPIAVYGASALDPLIFAHTSEARTRDDLIALDRYAVVMPMLI